MLASDRQAERRAVARRVQRVRRVADRCSSDDLSVWRWAQIVSRRIDGDPQRLAAAILAQALHDSIGTHCTRREQLDAVMWMHKRNTMQPCSFNWCCFVLELDPRDVLASAPAVGGQNGGSR